jgi:anti-sigma-K factor RskA
MNNKEKKERLLELLADQTIFGLSEEELTELEQLKSQFPDSENFISLELAATVIGLKNLDNNISMPEKLRAKVLADADEFFGFSEKPQTDVNFQPKSKTTVGKLATENIGSGIGVTSSRRFWQWSGWAFAAAACIALAFNLWLTRVQPPREIVESPETVQTPTPELSAAQKREQFIATAQDVVQTNWESPKGTKDISGDVVWSNSQQKGYVRFRGLPANNPDRETYQLWIVDQLRNEKYPISGGVFNVNESGEIIVPINAELKIKKPKMFVVSVEKPGGVVVSDPKRFLAFAKV